MDQAIVDILVKLQVDDSMTPTTSLNNAIPNLWTLHVNVSNNRYRSGLGLVITSLREYKLNIASSYTKWNISLGSTSILLSKIAEYKALIYGL